jgi:hypothetical protein
MVGLNRYSMTHEASETNVAKAKQFIKSMEASGGIFHLLVPYLKLFNNAPPMTKVSAS